MFGVLPKWLIGDYSCGMAKVGRPTDYNETIPLRTWAYLGEYESLGDAVPSIAGLAVELGVPRQRIYDWAKANEEFQDIIDILLAVQERVLAGGSLKNKLNPTIAKLILTKHGYSDKQELDHRSGDGSMTPPPNQMVDLSKLPDDVIAALMAARESTDDKQD